MHGVSKGSLMKTFAAAAASLLLAMPAMALPKLSVTYRDAALTVSPTDDIEIWVHVESSTPIDSSLGAPFGFEAADLPKTATLFGSQLYQHQRFPRMVLRVRVQGSRICR
jgi:hypothetical protein